MSLKYGVGTACLCVRYMRKCEMSIMGAQAATHLFYYVSESAFNILVTCFQLNNPALQKNNLDLVLGIYKHMRTWLLL